MNKKTIFFYFLLLLLAYFPATGLASDVIPARPTPPHLVNDFAGVLSPDEVAMLENKLLAFNDSTSNQVVIAIVNDLGGYDKSEYSFKLGNEWKIGRKEVNNGILVLVKPKNSTGEGEAFIATGKGLEGAIPDAVCIRIIDQEMIPYFMKNNYYGGLDAAMNVLMSLAKGEYSSAEYASKKRHRDGIGFPFIIIIAVVFFILSIFRNRGRGYTVGRGGYVGGYWGGFGGGGFGGGGGGSSSGGGFGGFGGGSFGGGGAGGSW